MHEEEVRLATHYRQFQTDHEYISDSNRSDLGKYSLKYVQVHKMSSMALKDIPYNNFFYIFHIFHKAAWATSFPMKVCMHGLPLEYELLFTIGVIPGEKHNKIP